MGLRSSLAVAKGTGSAKEGAHHWWMQRVTAIALVLLSVWVIYVFIKTSVSGASVKSLFASPFHAVAVIIFVGSALYHACLGMRVIYEDYISCRYARGFFIIATNFFSIVTAVVLVLAVVFAHIGYGKRSIWQGEGRYYKYYHSDSDGHKKYYKKRYKNKKWQHYNKQQDKPLSTETRDVPKQEESLSDGILSSEDSD